MTRPILHWPDKRLSLPAESVAQVTDETRAIWDEMVEVMEAMPGLGLAATQLGVMQRLAVVDASEERGQAVRLANPEIIEASEDTFTYDEGSPCLPGVSAPLTRPREVLVRFVNAEGQVDRRTFKDLWATSVQHQIDHLNGRMYFHNLSKLKRDRLLKKAAKMSASARS